MDILNTLFSNPWYWLIGGAVLMGLEIFAAGVYLLWIGAAMLTTGLAVALFPNLPLAAQLVVLIVAMVASILIGVRLQSRRGKDAASGLNAGLEQYVGRHVVAIQDFEAGRGRVKLEDTTYSALSPAPVKAGDTVVVTDVSNGTFQVAPPPGSGKTS